MPMAATMTPYTLFLLDDDMPTNPREDYDPFGQMICFHSRHDLGEKHDYDEPREFLQRLLFREYSSIPASQQANPVFEYIKAGKAKEARLEYNGSSKEWELLENNYWSSGQDWYASSSCPYPLESKDVPDWFLDDCLSTLRLPELMELVEAMEGMVILPLYLYDHSGITMNTTGFSCPWDSGQVGWIYADKEKVEKEYGEVTPETMEKARRLLEGEVKEYDCYISGQCYGFQLFKDEEEIDSCWGFLGELRDVQDAVKDHLPQECDHGIVDLLEFRYEDLDIDEYLDELREEQGDLCV